MGYTVNWVIKLIVLIDKCIGIWYNVGMVSELVKHKGCPTRTKCGCYTVSLITTWVSDSMLTSTSTQGGMGFER